MNMNITVNLSENDIKQAIKLFVAQKGFDVSEAHISLSYTAGDGYHEPSQFYASAMNAIQKSNEGPEPYPYG
jgi:hypothetical protein